MSVQIKSITYEESRLAYFKEQREKAERSMNYWCRLSSAERVGSFIAECNASESGARWSYYNDVIKMLENNTEVVYNNET